MNREKRVTKNEEFKEILDKNQKYSSKNILIFYRLKKEDHARIGISVKKKLGIAVVRNKIKRQIRMICNDILKNELNFDSIIIVKKDYLNNDFEQNRIELVNLYNKVEYIVRSNNEK